MHTLPTRLPTRLIIRPLETPYPQKRRPSPRRERRALTPVDSHSPQEEELARQRAEELAEERRIAEERRQMALRDAAAVTIKRRMEELGIAPQAAELLSKEIGDKIDSHLNSPTTKSRLPSRFQGSTGIDSPSFHNTGGAHAYGGPHGGRYGGNDGGRFGGHDGASRSRRAVPPLRVHLQGGGYYAGERGRGTPHTTESEEDERIWVRGLRAESASGSSTASGGDHIFAQACACRGGSLPAPPLVIGAALWPLPGVESCSSSSTVDSTTTQKCSWSIQYRALLIITCSTGSKRLVSHPRVAAGTSDKKWGLGGVGTCADGDVMVTDGRMALMGMVTDGRMSAGLDGLRRELKGDRKVLSRALKNPSGGGFERRRPGHGNNPGGEVRGVASPLDARVCVCGAGGGAAVVGSEAIAALLLLHHVLRKVHIRSLDTDLVTWYTFGHKHTGSQLASLT
eukprot:1184749-Prorocentrum_minimum.AAC.3